MANIKDLTRIGSKYARVTPQRSTDYEEGVSNPRRDWAQATEAAEDNYKAGVQNAIQRGSFGKGVRAAGSQKWQEKSKQLGPSRFAQGTAAAGDAYEQGFAPYHQVISSLQLPPRFPKGDDRNLQRVAAVNKALRNKKVQTG